MAERRNLIGALGVAVVALGLAALLSYAVALGAQQRRFDWRSPIPTISIAVMAAGAILVGGVLYRLRVVYSHRLKINDFVESGQQILNDLQSRTAAHFETRQRQQKWQAEVGGWLQGNMPHYRAHFMNLGETKDVTEIGDLARKLAPPGQMANEEDIRQRAFEEIQRIHLRRLADITGWL